MRFCLGLFLLLLGLAPAGPALGQRWVRGVVAEAGTGAALPAATIHVDGTTRGTIANAEGVFELYIDALPAVLVVRHIGYGSAEVRIDAATPALLDIRLRPGAVALGEVVVSGEDPALGIMRQVIARKKQWRAGLEATYAEVYTRFMLFSEQRLAQVKESIHAAYWRPDGGPRELVRARRTRPVGSGTFRFAQPMAVPNFYDDDVAVLGFTFVGPTHPDALDVYTFTLGGVRQQDSVAVFDIYFSPKAALRPAFSGRLAVRDAVFAVLEAQLRPDPNLAFAPPILDADLRFTQQFAPFADSVWLPVDLRMEGSVWFGRIGATYPRARFAQTSRLTLHALNPPSPDSLFGDDRRLFIHPAADHQDYLFRWNPGLIPLTAAEIELIAGLDPRMTLDRAFRAAGMLRQYLALEVAAPDEGSAPEDAAPGLLARAARDGWVWYNRVDGWHVGLRPTVGLAPGLTATPALAYDEAAKRLSGGGTLAAHGRRGALGGFARVGFLSGTVPRTPSPLYTRAAASTAYLGFDDYFDYYRNDRFFARLGLVLPHGVTLEGGLHVERHRSAARNANWEGWLVGDGQRDNPAITEGRLRSVGLRLAVGGEAGTVFAPPRPWFEVAVEHSPLGFLGSAFAFTSARAALDVRLATMARRRPWPAALRVRLTGSTARGTLPLQRFAAVDAALGPVARFGAFRTRRNRPYEGTRHAALFWEHDFATVLFERLGLWPLAHAGLGLAVYGAHGRTWLDPVRRRHLDFALPYLDGFHHEVGLSLTHLFNLPVRLDLSFRLDRPGTFVTVGHFAR